jgi:luciferase family oxidoreductase group 1
MRLSVLDQSIAVAGRPQGQSIRNTVSLARHCEALGYDRFWVSEHHNHPTIVGTAPEIVMAAIAATTQRIRIGSAGIMLPHYSPFKVAAARPSRSIPRPTSGRSISRPTCATSWRGSRTNRW